MNMPVDAIDTELYGTEPEDNADLGFVDATLSILDDLASISGNIAGIFQGDEDTHEEISNSTNEMLIWIAGVVGLTILMVLIAKFIKK